MLHDAESVTNLCNELESGSYKERPHKYFKVYEPKERDILSLAFRDRVYQRSLNDLGIYPFVEKSLITHNVACQTGKGTDFGRKELKRMMRRHYRKYGTAGFVAQMDVKGYYPNMNHKKVLEKFKKHLDPEIYIMVEEIINNFPNKRGFNPGSQLIQLAGITLLDPVDHFAKERKRVKNYIRYMDDIIALFPAREEAEDYLKSMIEEFTKYGCDINTKKTKIYPITDGVPFLGFRFHLSDSGKVYMIVKPEKIKNYKRKLRKLVKKAKDKNSKTTKEDVDRSFKTFCDYVSKGSSYNLLIKLRRYYKDLWEGDKHDRSEEIKVTRNVKFNV